MNQPIRVSWCFGPWNLLATVKPPAKHLLLLVNEGVKDEKLQLIP